jgi:hypothetical protein
MIYKEWHIGMQSITRTTVERENKKNLFQNSR